VLFGHNGEPTGILSLLITVAIRQDHGIHRQGPQYDPRSLMASTTGFARAASSLLSTTVTRLDFRSSGVSELPETAISDFQSSQAQRRQSAAAGLRAGWIRFGGNDTVDLKQWIGRVTDSQERKFRLAVDRSTLLIRSVSSQGRRLSRSTKTSPSIQTTS